MGDGRVHVSDVDAEGRPILIQVAMTGTEARRQGIVLKPADERTPEPAATAGDTEGLEQYLRHRIEQAVRKALPQATHETLDRLRRNERWYDDQ